MEHKYLELLNNDGLNETTKAAILCAETTQDIYNEIVIRNFEILRTGKIAYAYIIMLIKSELRKEKISVDDLSISHIKIYLDYRYAMFLKEELSEYIAKNQPKFGL